MDVRRLIKQFSLFFTTFYFSLSAPWGYSATQGQVGQTSSGSFSITLVIPPRLEANISTSAPENTTQTTANGLVTEKIVSQARFNEKESLCIKGTGISNYSLTAEGSGNQGSFVLDSRKDGSQRQLTYGVEFWANRDQYEALTSRQASQSVPPTPIKEDCRENGASIAVVLEQPPGPEDELSGVLNLTVSPE